MIVQLPDGSLWQDNGDGTYSQIATGFDDPAAANIDPGTVTQLAALPAAGQPTPPVPTQGTFPVGPISTPEEAAQIAAQGPLEPAPVPPAVPMVAAPPPPPTVNAVLDVLTTAQVALPPLSPNSFEWFGQVWTFGDLVDFKAALAAHGDNFEAWADTHPAALKLLTVGVNPLAAAQEAVIDQGNLFAQPVTPQAAPNVPPGTPSLFPPGYVLTFPALPGETPYVVPPSGPPAPEAPAGGTPAPEAPTGIPSGVLDHRNLEKVWVLAGGPEEYADLAAAVAQAESSGDPSRINNSAYPDRPGFHEPGPDASPEFSVGLWQVNELAHPTYLTTQLLQPLPNGQAAVAISNGGTDWSPWSTFTSGAYEKYLQGAPPPGGFEAPPAPPTAPMVAPPAGVQLAWTGLIDFAATGVPRHSAAVESLADSMIEVFR